MRGPESYSERSKWEDREALLCGAEHETGADDDAKPPVHPVRMRAFFVAAALTVFSSSLVASLHLCPLSFSPHVLQFEKSDMCRV
jgi:hypothetical protein